MATNDWGLDNTASIELASKELAEKGFISSSDQEWHGTLDCKTSGVLSVRVKIPPSFPVALPEVYVEREKLPRKIPHVEKNGKVCIAPNSGVLVDMSRPRAIVGEALDRAARTIEEGISGKNENDLIKEFLAYWDDGLMDGVCSICDTDGPTRVIYLGKGIQYQGRKKTDYLVSDSKGEAKKWVGNLGKEICEQSDSIFVRLENSPLPPDFGETYTVREVFRIIRDHSSNYSRSFFNSWLRKTLLPVTVIFSVPLPADLGRSLVGIRFNPASGEAARRGRKGFRAERVPAERQLSFSQDALTIRLFVNRLDAGFLVPRTGGVVKIVYRTVAVIGCGSVGSYTIEMLTRLGIGKLTLVDKETLGVENIHRHSLGFDAIGKNKAEAMRLSLSLRYPHLQIESFTQSIEELLQSKPEKVTGADVIVIALGDENLERFLNRHLHGSRPRVHVWLEPLGLAQHVLVADLNLGAGCYECLFESSKDKGLRNMAALAAPGQDLQKSFAGCGGSFAQFSAVDSSQAANLAATLTVKVLSGELTENVLLTRYGDPSTFLQAGFKIAERATLFKPGQVIESTNFSRQDCLVCINQG